MVTEKSGPAEPGEGQPPAAEAGARAPVQSNMERMRQRVLGVRETVERNKEQSARARGLMAAEQARRVREQTVKAHEHTLRANIRRHGDFAGRGLATAEQHLNGLIPLLEPGSGPSEHAKRVLEQVQRLRRELAAVQAETRTRAGG